MNSTLRFPHASERTSTHPTASLEPVYVKELEGTRKPPGAPICGDKPGGGAGGHEPSQPTPSTLPTLTARSGQA